MHIFYRLLVLLITISNSVKLNGQAIFDTIFKPQEISQFSNNLTTFDFDTSGNAWVGFSSNGLGKYNVETEAWTIYLPDSDLPDYQIRHIATSYNSVWLVMSDNNNEQKLYEFNNNQFIDRSALIAGKTITTAVSSKFSDAVYLLSNQGVILPVTGTFWSAQNSGLPNDTVYDLSEETPTQIWIGTQNGLAQLNGNLWTTINTNNSNIASNQIRQVEATNSEGIWFIASSNQQSGYYRIKDNQLSPNYLTILDDPLNELSSFSNWGLVQKNNSEVAAYTNEKIFSIINETLHSQSFRSDYYNSTRGPHSAKYHHRKDKFWYLTNFGSALLIHFNGEPFFIPGAIQTRNVSKLSINQMEIGFGNQGANFNFWQDGAKTSFEVPKGSNKIANGGTILCAGAYDENEKLHLSKFDWYYNEFAYQPGPLDTTNCSTNKTEQIKFDRLWNLNRWHIEEFQYHFDQGHVQNGSYTPHPDILTWPAHGSPGTNQARNLARFVDVNNNGIYNPLEEGDYPALMGDQTIFTIFNDSTAEATDANLPDLGLEIHQYAYAFTCPELMDEDSILNYTFFLHYDVFNRSNKDYNKMVFGYFQFPYFSSWNNNLTGSRPKNNVAFYYTPDTIAESPLEYGPKPPILSTIVLNGPLAAPIDAIDNDNDGVTDESYEKNLLSYFRTHNSSPFNICSDPFDALDYYHYLTDKWLDGSQLYYGQYCGGSGTPTRHAYPSWPFENDANAWSDQWAGDRRTIISSGPFNLAAGEKVSFDYAWIFNRNLNYAFNSEPFFLQVESNANIVSNWFEQQNYPSCFDWNLSSPKSKKFESKLLVYPNPAQNEVSILWKNLNSPQAFITVYDLQGKILQKVQVNNPSEIRLDTSALPDGFYLIEIADLNGRQTSKLAIIR